VSASHFLSRTPSTSPLTAYLIAEVDKVVGERLDGLCRVTRLDVLAVVADEDSLFRLDDADPCLALQAWGE
jgi:hypothetical protein